MSMATQLSDVDYIASLQARVKELEAENAKLLSRLADCHCCETEKKSHGPDEKATESIKGNRKSEEKIEKLTGYDTRFMSHHNKRYVALKVMYFGKRFYGFASEAQMEPTVESEIFKALEKTRLLAGDKKESQYSRCGRTDKGVSSVGQVIALFLRSKLKITGVNKGSSGGIVLGEQHEGEIDYVRVLNRVLPNDIRILGWCPVPVDFHARFSCLSREYRYFFWNENLNIGAMESAGTKFVGEHDFRNFCKMDAANVHNYRRHITMFEISPTDVRLRLVTVACLTHESKSKMGSNMKLIIFSLCIPTRKALNTCSISEFRVVMVLFVKKIVYLLCLTKKLQFIVCKVLGSKSEHVFPFTCRYDGNQLWVIKIRGSAFLWHQVRCMFAVLFLVGRGLESPDVIDMLLDTSRIPRKPQYTMASEVPLVLQSCEFEDIKFMCSSDAGEALHVHLVNECQIYQLQAAIFHEAILNCVPLLHDQSLLPIRGSKKKASHIPLMSRPTEPSYEERRAKLKSST